MKVEVCSLITPNAQAGLTLARQLADAIHVQIEQGNAEVGRPGGTNYLLPAPVPKEFTVGILLIAIAAANGGWADKV